MVLEGVFVNVVNKYLGDFIENLDKSQLNIKLLSGDVVLKNVYIKEEALSGLDLPFKVVHGSIENLVVKVPWKNLYTEPTFVTLDGLYMIAVPNTGVKYDADKEAQNEFEKKQKELARIEKAKVMEEEKGKSKEEINDLFVEKLAINIVKNLQVKVNNIHIRFEDEFTNREKPLAVGITLKGVDFQTCDRNWKPSTIKETVTKIYKKIQLDSFAVYWNPNTECFLRKDVDKTERTKLLNSLKSTIASADMETHLHYLIEPISLSAELTLNTAAEKEQFRGGPKLLLDVVIEAISVGLTKRQYQNSMEMLESIERMNLATLYRKYERPSVSITGKNGCRLWWNFAYRCILGERVRRRRKMWSWHNMKAHRKLCREYKELYKRKLLHKSVSEKMLEAKERELSVLNITVMRQLAGLEVKEKKKDEKTKKGWFSGWFRRGEEEKKDEITAQFQKEMTEEERAKLYEAIGYQENTADPTMPKDYIANKLGFKLKKLSIKLRDSEQRSTIADVQMQDISAAIAQRPGAEALQLVANIGNFTTYGCMGENGIPTMISSQKVNTADSLQSTNVEPLLEVSRRKPSYFFSFEKNPVDGNAETRVQMSSQPLEIVYDAHTVNQVADFFKPPEAVYLKQIQAAAYVRFEELREQTVTGLQHAIEQHQFVDISVDVQPCCVIIPYGGIHKRDSTVMVFDLGNLKVTTEKQQISSLASKEKKLVKAELLAKAYDKFSVRLEQVQILLAGPGDDWRTKRAEVDHMHILKPVALHINICRRILEDITLAKILINGELPNLSVNLSDVKLKEILDLVQSIPFPESTSSYPEQRYYAPELEYTVLEPTVSTQQVLRTLQNSNQEEILDECQSSPRLQTSTEYFNPIDMEVSFALKEVALSFSQVKNGQEVSTLKAIVSLLETEIQLRTFDLMAAVSLGGILVQYQQTKGLDD